MKNERLNEGDMMLPTGYATDVEEQRPSTTIMDADYDFEEDEDLEEEDDDLEEEEDDDDEEEEEEEDDADDDL